MKVLAVVPARSGSKDIKKKNLRLFDGKPLVAHAIINALNSKLVDRVVLSTDDPKIAKIGEKYGAEVPFLRPKRLAKDNVSIIPVLIHAMKFFDNTGWHADVIVSVQPTAPFLQPVDIDKALRILKRHDCDSVVSVTRVTRPHPFWVMKLKSGKLYPFIREGFRYLQRQDLPDLYFLNGALYVRKRHLLEKWSGKDFALGSHVRGIVLDERKSVDINSPQDLFLAEFFLKMKRKKNLFQHLNKEFPIYME